MGSARSRSATRCSRWPAPRGRSRRRPQRRLRLGLPRGRLSTLGSRCRTSTTTGSTPRASRGRWSSPASCRRCRSIRCEDARARAPAPAPCARRCPLLARGRPTPGGAHARGGLVTGLPVDERQICDALLGRLAQGRRQYGPWRLDDGRDYPSEAYAEVLDGLHYGRRAGASSSHRGRSASPRLRLPSVRERPGRQHRAGPRDRQFLIDDGALPIAPHLYLPQLIDDATGREQALALCLELLATCDGSASSATSSPKDGARAARGEAARHPSSLRSGGAGMSGALPEEGRWLRARARPALPRGHAGRDHPARPPVPHGRGDADVDCPVFWPGQTRQQPNVRARCARPETPPRPDESPSPSSATTAPSRSLR